MFVCVAGKNNIAVDVLEYLIFNCRDRYQLGIVCNKNEKGVNSWQKSLRKFAEEHAVKEYRLEELYEKEQLVFISLEFDQIVKPELFSDAQLYNIHFSLLPQYKGMYTSAIPILNGERYVGVTFHKIDQGIDTGDIIAQKKFELNDEYTCRDLYLQYIVNGTRLVLENIENVLDGNVRAIPQPKEDSTYYSKKYIDYSNLKIDLRQTAAGIKRQIRAFSFREYQMPVINGKQIIAAQITNIHSRKPAGTVLMINECSMMMSTIDYNIILYFDRFEELLDACRDGNLQMVKDICAVKEHIYAANEKGWTPLIVATYNNQIEIVKYLISMGADIQVKNINGTNLLMYAKDAYINSGNIELFRMFFELGLDIKACDYDGKNVDDYMKEIGRTVQDLFVEMNKEK